jgi:SAD/SRA domain
VFSLLAYREALLHSSSHLFFFTNSLLQRGVSGNHRVGCNAIVVSGKKNREYSEDTFVGLAYAATAKEGAMSLMRSWKNGNLIRVFRSSKYDSEFRADPLDGKNSRADPLDGKNSRADPLDGKNSSTLYRFDGLYEIYDVSCRENELTGKQVFQFAMAQQELRSSRRRKEQRTK